jgi:intracellular sulfur oxidation DsrE/DsrF family protein
MKPMRLILLSLALLAVSGYTLAAEKPAGNDAAQTPALVGVGKVYPLPRAAYQPRRDDTFSVVFSITKPAAEPGDTNPSFRTVARIVNLYASAGVPLSHLQFVVVVDGQAIDSVLDNAHYRQKYGVDNPNLILIRTFRNAGIDVAACGQTLTQLGQEGWVSPEVTLALSGVTTIINLQHQGYALVPL